MYVTVEEVREAGSLPEEITDEQIELSILRWQELVDRITGQWFEVRGGTLLMDGSGSEILHMPVPIVQLDELYLNNTETEEPTENYQVYDGRDGLQDDRKNPKIVLYRDPSSNIFTRTSRSSSFQSFTRGRKNQKLVGEFGFVVPDAEAIKQSIVADEGNLSSDQARLSGQYDERGRIYEYEVEITLGGTIGNFLAQITRLNDNELVLPPQTFSTNVPVAFDKGMSIYFITEGALAPSTGDKYYITAEFDGAPRLIKKALIKLILIKDFSDQSDEEGSGTHGAIKREKTDGHEIEFFEVSVGSSEYSGIIGDDEISGLLQMYKRPPLISPSSWRII